MKVKASVELAVSLVPSGIQVGETLITWGFILENPEIRSTLRYQLDGLEAQQAPLGFSVPVDVARPDAGLGYRTRPLGSTTSAPALD